MSSPDRRPKRTCPRPLRARQVRPLCETGDSGDRQLAKPAAGGTMPTNDKSDNKSGIMAEDIKTMVMSLMREDSFTDRLLNLVTETVAQAKILTDKVGKGVM